MESAIGHYQLLRFSFRKEQTAIRNFMYYYLRARFTGKVFGSSMQSVHRSNGQHQEASDAAYRKKAGNVARLVIGYGDGPCLRTGQL